MSGRKDDQLKPDLSLVPLSALVEEARGFQYGAQKYGRNNYRGGLESHRLVAACLRHLLAWEQGEDLDPESGVSHLGHARCCLAMILELQRLGRLIDTRWELVTSNQIIQDLIEEQTKDNWKQFWEQAEQKRSEQGGTES